MNKIFILGVFALIPTLSFCDVDPNYKPLSYKEWKARAISLKFENRELKKELKNFDSQEFQPLKALGVGFSLVAEDVALQNTKLSPDLSVMHLIELQATDYAFTDGFLRIFPKDARWLAPIIVFSMNTIYRVPELNRNAKNNQVVFTKMIVETTAIFGRLTFDF